jgi:hypothetical protein
VRGRALLLLAPAFVRQDGSAPWEEQDSPLALLLVLFLVPAP